MGKGEKIKVGVFGLGRGQAFLHPHEAVGIEIAAVCDARRDKVDLRLQGLPKGVRGYTEFEDLIASDVDAVILCNYFDEHAPFAIRALRAGKHVMSECASNATVAEGVALCREVERAGKVYMLAENYPFTRATMELRRIYRAGELGRALYGDGEYNHPMPADEVNRISPGEFHWRNNIPASYYCTHAYAPLMAATGAMPVSVNALAVANGEVNRGTARRSDVGTVILARMDDGSVFKQLGISFPGHSGYYRIHGTRGAAEIDRRTGQLYVWHDPWDIPEGSCRARSYVPEWPEFGEIAEASGHGGGDFWTSYLFAKSIREGTPPPMDVYFGVAASTIGILAWKSALAGGAPFDMPDFRSEASRAAHGDDRWNPILKAGMDKASIPPSSVVGYEPNGEDLARARAEWARTGHWGLG